jgi:hypothetical protein
MSPYGQSRYHNTEKLEKETHDDYEKRTWLERAHINSDGFMFIPPMSLKHCVAECAKFLSVQIPGRGKATYTKHFEAGLMIVKPIVLVTREEIKRLALHVPSDGRPGGEKRVMKYFPYVETWEGEAEYHILDDTITEPVFEYHLKQAGQFIGIGFSRPRRRGYWGRFEPTKFSWA